MAEAKARKRQRIYSHWWLPIGEIHVLAVLEVRSLKSRHLQGHFLLELLEENSFHASLLTFGGFQTPVAFLGL